MMSQMNRKNTQVSVTKLQIGLRASLNLEEASRSKNFNSILFFFKVQCLAFLYIYKAPDITPNYKNCI